MNYYDENAEDFTKATIDVDMSSLYNEFLFHLKDGTSILDAGCGPGRDVQAFLSRGYIVDAFDKSQAMIANAESRTGIKIHHSTFQEFKSTKKFDGVWCCASLLHVPFRNLEYSIENMVNVMKKDGIIYMSFKYGEKERLKDGRHFTDLTEETLSALIKKVGSLKKIKGQD